MVQVTLHAATDGVVVIDLTGDSSERIKSIAVQKGDDAGPIWWIVSCEYSETWSAVESVELLGDAAEKGRALIESLSPETTGNNLSGFTYGQVPDGFRQVVPEEGPPPRLERKVRYILDVLSATDELNIAFHID